MTLEERHAHMIHQAIQERRLLSVKLIDEQHARLCIPFDCLPNGNGPKGVSIVLYELEDTGIPGSRLEIASDRLLALRLLDLRFRPEEFIGWPKSWHVPRDWPGLGVLAHGNLTGV